MNAGKNMGMPFYNRMRETKDIVGIVEEDKDANKIIVLSGTTGVGKSGLVCKLLNDELANWRSIRVGVSKSSIDTIENLHYLNAIYKAIYELAKKNLFDNIPTPAQQGTLSLKRIFQFIIGVAKAKAGIDEKIKLFEPVEDIGVIRKKDYIIDVLKRNHFIVNIENIQNIDTQSLEIFTEILKRVKGTTFVLEYTLGPKTKDDLMNFINELSTLEAVIFPYTIEKLAFEEAQKLAPQSAKTEYDENLLMNIYSQANGNLMQIILYNNNNGTEVNPIKASIDSLLRDEKYIVNIIYLNEGIINCTQLFQMILNSRRESPIKLSQPYLVSLLDGLIVKNIIIQNGDIIRISHDSIMAELEEQKVNPLLYSAYGQLTDYYWEQKQLDPFHDSSVERLFSLYLKFSDEAVTDILDDLKYIILKCKYPHTMIAKLSRLKDKLLEKQSNLGSKSIYEMILMMVGFSYDMDLGKVAQENLDIIYDSRNPLHRAYQVGILSLDCSSIKQRDLIRDMVAKAPKGSRLKLTMELCLLTAMMQACPLVESKKFAESLMFEKEYDNFLEYGFLLRNYAEMVDYTNESIELYKKCLQIFEQHKRKDLQAQIFISLSMSYSYKGLLETAKNYIMKALDISNRPLKENFVLNNLAVIEILAGSFTEQVEKDLNDSLLITSNEYEQVIIRCNLLIYYVMTRQNELARQTSQAIECCNYEKFEYEELQHIVYQNLMFYYETINSVEQQNYYATRIQDLIYQKDVGIGTKQLAELLLAKKRVAEIFYSNFPFRADFLGYWGFEISRDLEHFEPDV